MLILFSVLFPSEQLLKNAVKSFCGINALTVFPSRCIVRLNILLNVGSSCKSSHPFFKLKKSIEINLCPVYYYILILVFALFMLSSGLNFSKSICKSCPNICKYSFVTAILLCPRIVFNLMMSP